MPSQPKTDWPWLLLRTCKLLCCVCFQELLHSAFRAARVYSRTLEHFRHFYKDNKGLDLDLLRQQDHGRSNWGQCRFMVNVTLTVSSFPADLPFFEKSLETYSSQQRDALSIQQTTPLGLLLVDKQRFRETFESLLQSCLEVTCVCVHTLSTLLLLVKKCEDYTPPPHQKKMTRPIPYCRSSQIQSSKTAEEPGLLSLIPGRHLGSCRLWWSVVLGRTENLDWMQPLRTGLGHPCLTGFKNVFKDKWFLLYKYWQLLSINPGH